ncbi:hypothetical protein Syun_006610 [Stephania yunnanensis]|uniref:ADF-H domain-containing protein n=1 Tax=Stephania yunnanensis TaxID=152371 RepID=A0AAP0PZG9_9MAGN
MARLMRTVMFFVGLDLVTVDDDLVVVLSSASSGMGVADHCTDAFLELQRKKVHRYVVFKIDEKKKKLWLRRLEMSKIFFIAWSPASSRIRAKMLYATSKDRFRRTLEGIHYEIQATDASEMDLEVLRERAH